MTGKSYKRPRQSIYYKETVLANWAKEINAKRKQGKRLCDNRIKNGDKVNIKTPKCPDCKIKMEAAGSHSEDFIGFRCDECGFSCTSLFFEAIVDVYPIDTATRSTRVPVTWR